MDSEPKLLLLISQLIRVFDTMNWDPDSFLSNFRSVITQITLVVRSMDLDSEPETELMSLASQTMACFKSMDLDSQPDQLKKLIALLSQDSDQSVPVSKFELQTLIDETFSFEPLPELISLIQTILSTNPFDNNDPELKLKSLITRLIFVDDPVDSEMNYVWSFISLSIKIISVVSSVDWDSQQKPESELMFLIKQTISVFNSVDLDSQPEPLRTLVSLASQRSSFVNFRDENPAWDEVEGFMVLLDEDDRASSESGFVPKEFLLDSLHANLFFLVGETFSLEPEPKLISLIHQIFSLVMTMNSKWKKLVSICPQVQLAFQEGELHVVERGSWSRTDKWAYAGGYVKSKVSRRSNNKWDCLPFNWEKFRLHGEKDATHFLCRSCYGENHQENSKAPVEIKHPLHPKHSLQLVSLNDGSTRLCYCCDEDLKGIFYYCSACNFGIKFTCANKTRVLSINHPKWHEHTLALFPSQAPFTCSLCALAHSKCPFYICPPCDVVIHQSCLSLPHVIKISRHPHRISFTHSFQKGDWSCGICRKRIDNDYGAYSCNKESYLYVVHAKCATQKNVWDGVELEGEPEEDIEEVEPFVMISNGIIQHFSHEHHHLRLDENTERDYDENKLCEACITPVYYGNFYSCMKCDYILHEECAKLSRKIHHPIHPHPLTLVTYQSLTTDEPLGNRGSPDTCSACPSFFTAGFFYTCGQEQCDFKLHVPCATISEPLVHSSHMHPLFLTSKPDEERICSVCNKAAGKYTKETFNCIEDKCDFALCFKCATLPQKLRYKHDKHILYLSYEDKTNPTTYWCEACEEKINLKKGFYMCDEYCCVMLHIECVLGEDLYMTPCSWPTNRGMVSVLRLEPNTMSRPICIICQNYCPQKVVYHLTLVNNRTYFFCSLYCFQYR